MSTEYTVHKDREIEIVLTERSAGFELAIFKPDSAQQLQLIGYSAGRELKVDGMDMYGHRLTPEQTLMMGLLIAQSALYQEPALNRYHRQKLDEVISMVLHSRYDRASRDP